MSENDFRFIVDEPSKLLTLRFRGIRPSAWYIDQVIEAYASIEKPWLYNRLLDHRQFSALNAFEDVERLAKFWTELKMGITARPRVAILSADPLKHARCNMYGDLFPNQEMHHFTDLYPALDWLNQER